jgi:hypothetical protein
MTNKDKDIVANLWSEPHNQFALKLAGLSLPKQSKLLRVSNAFGQQVKFCLTDENVLNDRGQRILVNGIDLDRFRKNPVLYYNHNYQNIPIGKWTNIGIVNGMLVGTPIFDEKDSFAKIVKQKIDDGFLNACSIGIMVLETSKEEKMMLAGQTSPTITKSELFEVSIVDLPANKNSVRIITNPKI